MLTTTADLKARVWEALGTIEDPELPITVVDLGLIDTVHIDGGQVRITMIPTFSACPAIDVMRKDITACVERLPGVSKVQVDLSFARPWTMDRMTDRGRERLRRHGMSVAAGGPVAAFPRSRVPAQAVACPFCGSTNTTIENPFGPTLCRAIYYCNDCKNPIERFKPPRDD